MLINLPKEIILNICSFLMYGHDFSPDNIFHIRQTINYLQEFYVFEGYDIYCYT